MALFPVISMGIAGRAGSTPRVDEFHRSRYCDGETIGIAGGCFGWGVTTGAGGSDDWCEVSAVGSGGGGAVVERRTLVSVTLPRPGGKAM